MAAFSRGLRPIVSQGEFTCARCLLFSTTSAVQSGHNRWSKIKHDKGAADRKKNVQRSAMSKEITLCSKLFGADPNLNPKLATLCANAKKAGFPKASMDAAIARGQGKSLTGLTLKNMTFEVMLPSTVAVIIEAETDNEARTQMDIRDIIRNKEKGTVTPVSFLFTKKGRISFEADERNLTADDVLDEAIEAGAEDVEDDGEGGLVVWTEAGNTSAAADTLQKSLNLKVASSDIIWDANEDTKVPINDSIAKSISTFLDRLEEEPTVQAVYTNVAQGETNDDLWEDLVSKLEA